MTVSLDLQNVKLRQMRSKLFLMSYQQKWVRRFHVCLVLHKKYENYMCKSIVYIQEQWLTEPGKYRAYRAESAWYFNRAEPSNTEPSLTEYLR